MPDTAAGAAAVNQLSGVPIVPEQWGETTAPPFCRDLSSVQLAERHAFIMTAVFILTFRVILDFI